MNLFGELYLRSTKPFLNVKTTTAEVNYLNRHVVRRSRGPVLDVGCGHGRHLLPLQNRKQRVMGVDFDQQSLDEVVGQASVVRGDFFHLPFADASFGAAYSWYNTVFTFEDEQQRPLLREIVRVLKPGGTLLLQCSNKWVAAAQPESNYDGLLPDGSHLFEQCMYSAERSRDELTRRLTLPDGRKLEARFFIRYYDVEELKALLDDVGCEFTWVHGGVDEGPPTKQTAEVIMGVTKRG